MAATAAVAAVAVADDRVIKTATVRVLVVLTAPEQARPLPMQDGKEPRFARDATVLKADGTQAKVSIVGTAKQWQWFTGVSCEGRLVKQDDGTAKWYFSPVASFPDITDPNAF